MAPRRARCQSRFRADMLTILGEMYSELSLLRKAVRPARLFGETPVEELMDLIAGLIVDCDRNESPATMDSEYTDQVV